MIDHYISNTQIGSKVINHTEDIGTDVWMMWLRFLNSNEAQLIIPYMLNYFSNGMTSYLTVSTDYDLNNTNSDEAVH